MIDAGLVFQVQIPLANVQCSELSPQTSLLLHREKINSGYPIVVSSGDHLVLSPLIPIKQGSQQEGAKQEERTSRCCWIPTPSISQRRANDEN